MYTFNNLELFLLDNNNKKKYLTSIKEGKSATDLFNREIQTNVT